MGLLQGAGIQLGAAEVALAQIGALQPGAA